MVQGLDQESPEDEYQQDKGHASQKKKNKT